MTTDPKDAEIARLTAELREARMQVLASNGQAQMAYEAAEAEVALWKEAKEAVERDVDREYKRAEKAESELIAIMGQQCNPLTAAAAEKEKK